MTRLLAIMFTCAVLAPDLAWSRAALTVCLQVNDPPLSKRGDNAPRGFAFALFRTISERLGRDPRVQWFVGKDDSDTNLIKDTNALLSDGRCELMAEYPMLISTLRHPLSPSAKLPPFDGATPDDRRRWVKTNDLSATRPYRSDGLTVVLSERAETRPIHRLADLDGLRIGVQIATLSDAIAMRYGGGQLVEHIVHMRDGDSVFDRLASGEIDAAFANLHSFDAWRVRHASSGLSPTGYIHSLTFNMGFVGLETNAPLIRDFDTVLADLLANDGVAALAEAAGLTFLPPRTPAVQADVRADGLIGD